MAPAPAGAIVVSAPKVVRVLRPVDSSRRVVGVDVARSLALIGMAATHIFPGFTPAGELHLSHAIASGRAAALFAVLAGVGLALVTGGHRPLTGRALRGARAGVLARAALLLVLGLLLGKVDSPPLVILAYYALLFLVAVPFLGLSSRTLALLAVAAAVVTPLASYALRQVVDPTPIAEPGGRDLFVELFLTGTYPVLTWTTYLFAGLAVGRTHLRRVGVAARLLVGGAALAVVAKIASAVALNLVGGRSELAGSTAPLRGPVDDLLAVGLFGTTPPGDWRWLTVSAPHSGTTFDLAHTVGTSLAVLGLCLLLARVLPRWTLVPFAAVGSMTLTLYTLHVLVVANDSPLLTDDRFTFWAAQVVVALVVATVWQRLVGRGPLETVSSWISGRAAAAVTRR
jgi:uncharacterized membrane protein YeiB